MPHLSIFNIGTSHNRNESTNLLVKLFNDCPSLAIDDATIDDATISLNGRGNSKVINDGVGSKDPSTGKGGKVGGFGNLTGGILGIGVMDRTERMVNLVARMKPTAVTISGHSRGAIIAVRIAAYLWEAYKRTLPVNLWLLDPVKVSAQGTDFYNREIHPNVQKNLRIVVMEDTSDVSSPRGGFKLLTLKSRAASGGGRTDVVVDKFIRMPGSHGTGSQVNGNPIGELTFQIARQDLMLWGVPVGVGIWGPLQICNEYFKIHKVNPVTRIAVGKVAAAFGYTSLSREVNDEDAKTGMKTVTTDSRAQRLDGKGITNRFRGHRFFINEHHYVLFASCFSQVAHAVLTLSNNVDMEPEQFMAQPGFGDDLRRVYTYCPASRPLLVDGYGFDG